MKIVKRKAEELKHFKKNPRMITDEEFEKLKKSIKKFGLVDPLVIDEKNNIIGGNQRYDAACDLGIKTFDCSLVTGLKESEKKALNIALNKISGTWDNNMLLEMLEEIKSEEETFLLSGYTEPELNALISEGKKAVSFLAREKEYGDDMKTDHECPKCGYKF